MHRFRKDIGYGAVIHELKTDPAAWIDMYSRDKGVEIRLNDRTFEVSDYILSRQTQYSASTMACTEKSLIYTGRTLLLEIVHIQSGYGLKEGYVALSVKVLG